MKRIKYRAWNKKENRWANFNDLMSEIPVGATVRPPSVLVIGDDEWELLPYTGLKDKNGKEIYEGDIIEGWDSEAIWNWLVKWNDEYSSFYIHHPPTNETFYLDDLISVCEKGKVVGNIYENPELVGDHS